MPLLFDLPSYEGRIARKPGKAGPFTGLRIYILLMRNREFLKLSSSEEVKLDGYAVY
jgi:hypothetical protein